MLSKASSRLHILRVCKYYGYSKEEITILFDSLIMLLFTYAIKVWVCAYEGKYLVQIDKFCKRAEKYGYTNKRITIGDIIRNRDRQLWEKITTENQCLNSLLPNQRTRRLRERGHNFILPRVNTERFKRTFKFY